MPQYNSDLLAQILERDGATRQPVLNEKLTGQTRIHFICGCGTTFRKAFVDMYKSGCYCLPCRIPKSKAKYEATCLQVYGKKNPRQCEEVKEKAKETCLKKFGTTTPLLAPQIQEKIKAIFIEKFGVAHPLQNQEIRQKTMATMQERYNCDHGLQSPEIFQKTKDSLFENFKVNHPSQSEEVKQKMKETFFKNFGHSHPLKSEEVKAKLRATVLEKYKVSCVFQDETVKEKTKATWMQNFGESHPSKSEEFKEKYKATCLKRFKTENAMQNAEVADNNLKKSYKCKEVVRADGTIIYLQGYEPQAYKILCAKYAEDEIITSNTQKPEIWWTDADGKSHRYYPDFFIPKDNMVVEIKSQRTFDVGVKEEKISRTTEAVKALGYNFEIWIMNKEGKILQKH